MIYLYLLIFLLIYIYLINYYIRNKKYFYKIIIASSISILFFALYSSIKSNEGYSVTESLPNKFYILNTYTDGGFIFILIKGPNNKPRLYRLEQSIEITKFLKKYNKLKMNGQDVMVNKSKSISQNNLGLSIESVRKQLPVK